MLQGSCYNHIAYFRNSNARWLSRMSRHSSSLVALMRPVIIGNGGPGPKKMSYYGQHRSRSAQMEAATMGLAIIISVGVGDMQNAIVCGEES